MRNLVIGIFLLIIPALAFADECMVGAVLEANVANSGWGTVRIVDADEGKIKLQQVHGRDTITGKPSEIWYSKDYVICRKIDPASPSQYSAKFAVRVGDDVEVHSGGKWEPAVVAMIRPEQGALTVYMPGRQLEDYIDTKDKVRRAAGRSASGAQQDIDNRKLALNKAFDDCVAQGIRPPSRKNGFVLGAPGKEIVAQAIQRELMQVYKKSASDPGETCIVLGDEIEYLPRKKYDVDWSSADWPMVYPVRLGITVLRKYGTSGVKAIQRGFDGQGSRETLLFFDRGGGWTFRHTTNW